MLTCPQNWGRPKRKAFREHARVENATAAYARELAALLDERGFTHDLLLSEAPTNGEAVLVGFPRFGGQVSGLHRNDCRGCRKALLVIDWTKETDR